jgi:uncharacterized protein (TIGR03083 family)
VDKALYLSHLHADGNDLLAAAGRDLTAAVPGCPGWTNGVLAGHIGYVWAAWTGNLRARGDDREPMHEEDFAEWPRLWEWIQAEMPVDSVPQGVVDWAERQLRALESELDAADPDQPCRTWFPPDQTAGFAMRRMALEAIVHRWDAESAIGTTNPIDGELARDGVDEMFDVHLPMLREWTSPRPGAGESYHFHRTDGDGEWLVRFNPDGVTISREHGKAGVAIRGTASDLLLFLWGRVPGERLEVFGEEELVTTWFELVPQEED